MTYEEYFKQNPKARLIAQCMMDNMAKQASMPKQAVNWGAMAGNIGKAIQTGAGKASKAMHAGLNKIDDFGRTMAGKAQRAGERIGKAYEQGAHKYDHAMIDTFNPNTDLKALRAAMNRRYGQFSALKQMGREVGNAGRMVGRGIKNSPLAQAALVTGGLGAGAVALNKYAPETAAKINGAVTDAARRLDMTRPENAWMLPASDPAFMGKMGSAQIPPAMRLMAHIIDGDGEWIAKVAACCKKSGKCSKVEHKQMPGK